jgi:hypothetical protein
MPEITYEVVQGGMVVASVTAPDLETATREAYHYAMMYRQDAPCIVRRKMPRKKKTETTDC